MSYSTVDRVRSESGFDGNLNIKSSMIETYLEQANGIVKSYVASVYDISEFTGEKFTGSQGEKLLKRAEELIASGYLLIKQYGADSVDTDKDGYEKVKEGEGLLQRLTDKDHPLRLMNTDNTEFSRVSKSTAGTIVASGATSGENIFSVDDTY